MTRYFALAAIVFVSACNRETPTMCTLIGCGNDLRLEIENAPHGPLTIRATPVGTPDSARTVTCPGDTGCTNSAYFLDFAPVHVHVTVTTTAGSREWDVRPTFLTSQPNGPRCPEICRSGTVRLRWQ